MSGFFCVAKKTLAKGRAQCNPIGFKIGLEIMARCRCKNVVDVPITFQDRVAGESKLSMKQNVMVAATYSSRNTAMSVMSLCSRMPAALIKMQMKKIDTHIMRKYCANHADQCTQPRSPIIFIDSFSFFSFSCTTLRLMLSTV